MKIFIKTKGSRSEANRSASFKIYETLFIFFSFNETLPWDRHVAPNYHNQYKDGFRMNISSAIVSQILQNNV